MKKIVFGITSMGVGGAERVIVDLVNELSKSNEYNITIFTIYSKGELEKQISPKVTIKSIYENSHNQLTKIKQKLSIPLYILIWKNKIYKKYIENKYDIEIAFLEGPITRIFSCGKNKKKKIAWVHTDISQIFGTNLKAKIKRKIDEHLYNKFSKLIFVSKSNLESFNKIYKKNKAEKQVIYNYIDKYQVLKKAEVKIKFQFNSQTTNLVSVARLVPQKRFNRLIKVHSRLINEGINHNLYIIGDGPEKEKLQELIKINNCKNTVQLLGKKENPYPYIKRADYICLFSEFEGYGMILEEAKILEKYILITDTAAKEAIQNYPKSQVFENSEEGIYKGLKKILIGKNNNDIKESKQQNYTNYHIIEEVKKLLDG